MKTILLTGATGFLGSWIIESLIERKYKVVILKRKISNTWRIDKYLGAVHIYETENDGIEKVFKFHEIYAIIHLASQYGRDGNSLEELIETNICFGIRVLNHAIKNNVKLFINSDTFYSNIKNKSTYLEDYSITKRHFKEYLKLKKNKINIINMIIHHMYGPKDDKNKFITSILTSLINQEKMINLTKGQQLRDFIYVHDVALAFMQVLIERKKRKKYEEYDVCSGYPMSIKELVNIIVETYETSIGKNKTQLNFGAIEVVENKLINKNITNKLLKDIGWNNYIGINEGIKNTLKYLQK